MCILFIAVNQHPDFPLIIAANRDEFHERPTAASSWWPQSDMLAGKDLRAGGTWMGVSKRNRFAAITNIRAPHKEKSDARTRGELVSRYLMGSQSPKQYLSELSSDRNLYNGYNLLFGNLNGLFVFNSFENQSSPLDSGIYGLSNANLDSAWPKLDLGKTELARYCKQSKSLDNDHLFALLSNEQVAADEDLPSTGVSLEWEQTLSSIFIKTDVYGTRSSTVLLLDNDNRVHWEERSYSPSKELTNVNKQEFALER